jgi:hypothetical protein
MKSSALNLSATSRRSGGSRAFIQQRLADLGAVAVLPNSPDEFAKFIAENIDKWTKVIKFGGAVRRPACSL